MVPSVAVPSVATVPGGNAMSVVNTKKFVLNGEQQQMLLNYLYQRPYAEVARGVEMLQSLPELKVAEAEAPVEPLKLAKE